MNIINENLKAVDIAVQYLTEGKLIFMATETVYIAVVDAENSEAVKKLVSFKNRPFGKPFSVGVTDIKMAEKYVVLNKTAKNLYKKFLPGPITVVSQGKHVVAPGVEAEDGTLGIRIPDYPFFQKVVKKFGKPITTTSANASYQRRPYKLSDILDHISEKQRGLIDLMIDAGQLPEREPSTVIDTTLDDPIILRQGDIKLKDKNEVLSRSAENTQNIGKELFQKYEKYLGNRSVIFALEGEMGVGKTVLTKGLAKAMGISDLVTSPTFALENKYHVPGGKHNLHHFDAWRMENSDDLMALEFKNLIKNKEIIAIEWAERVADAIHNFDDEAVVVWVKISYGNKENERFIGWGVI